MPGANTHLLNHTYFAGGVIRRHRFCRQTGAELAVEITASTQRSKGVSLDAVVAADIAGSRTKTVTLVEDGTAWVEAGAAVAIGDRIMSDTQGRAVLAATATNIPAGVAESATVTGAGELVLVRLTPGMPAL